MSIGPAPPLSSRSSFRRGLGRTYALLLLLSVLAAGCGDNGHPLWAESDGPPTTRATADDGDGDGADDTATDDSEPVPERIGLQPGEVGLFLAVHTGSSDVRVENMTLHTDTGAIILVVPAADRAVEISSHRSPDYATSSVWLLRSGDRVFTLRKWGSGSLDLSEIDVGAARSFRGISIWDDASPHTFAVIGDTAHYRISTDFDALAGGNIGGEYVALPIEWDGGGALRGEKIDGAEAPWRFRGDGNLLYGLEKDEDQLLFRRIDPASGVITEIIGSFTVTEPNLYEESGWEFSFDDGVVYWTSLRSDTGDLALWSYAGGDLPTLVSQLDGTTLTAVLEVDVDDGHFVLQARDPSVSDDDFLILYHQDTNEWEYLDLGVSIYDVRIVHRDED